MGKKREITLSNKEILKQWNKIKKNLLDGKYKGNKETKKLLNDAFKDLKAGDKAVLTSMALAFTEGLFTAYKIASEKIAEPELKYIG